MVIMAANKAAMSLLLFITFSAITCQAFTPGSVKVERATALHALDRRAFVAAGIAGATSTVFADASFASQPKVLVVGGTGMVGSEVVKLLKEMGVEVVATSTDGRDGTEALDFRTEKKLAAKIEALAKGCTAVISCVGVVGTEEDAMVNSASGLAAFSAKSVVSPP
jgi:NADPH:quinone reductase-like Zn-dependent oxidoreductase